MCGICGIWGKTGGKKETLRQMLSQIEHRGNSLYETGVFGDCAMGTNRLEIVDRDNGRQPKINEDGTVFAILNGEIFNYKALKTELEASGHKFKTDCDTECLVHLYEEYGERMMEKIDSEMFAFAVYDMKENRILVARDRWGVKPLYYSHGEDGSFYFASEIKALSGLAQVEKIGMVEPGHMLIDGKIRRYYSPGAPEKAKLTDEQAALMLRALVDEAVKKRVQTDLPVAVLLSGGLDSTAILATARKYHKNVTAVIVGSKGSDDVRFAKRYCEEFGVRYIHREPPSEQELFGMIKEIVRTAESFEPNVVRQSAVSYFISKAASELGIRIVLCGEGADELFIGYPEFWGVGKVKAKEMQNHFLNSLNRTQFQRVDRTSMHFTIEVRVPFFDDKVVEFARSLPVRMNIKEIDGQKVEKYILRRAMEDRLPPYICNRRKVVLSEGAGFGGNGPGGLFEALAGSSISDDEFVSMQKEFEAWNILTREEAFYFSIFRALGYCKAGFNSKRVTANRMNSTTARPAETLEEKVLRTLTEKKFVRFRPKKEDRVMEIVKLAMRRKKPVELFMLWGIWKKTSLDSAEDEALGIIDGLLSEVQKAHPQGAKLTIVVTDTHAELNLMDKMRIYGYDSYLGTFERFAKARGYNVVRLSEILLHKRAENLDVDGNVESIRTSRLWPILVAAASRYYEGSSPEEGAKAYVRCRLVEKETLQKVFRQSIFLTYNGPSMDVLAPDLPTLYVIPNRKRTNTKPWFKTM